MSELVTRPISRYYGSKWRVAPQIVAMLPAHDLWVDAFCGLGNVTLRKERCACEVLNDLNEEVVNAFEQLRRRGAELQRLLSLTPYSRVEYERAYHPTSDRLEAARRFIFRSAAGMGSDSGDQLNGFRTSLCDKKYSAALSWAKLPETIEAVIGRLRGVIIENRPAEEVMERFDSARAVHYVDPPYLGMTRKNLRKRYKHEMSSIEDHERLLTFIRTLRGRVMVSGYPCGLYDRLLADWCRVSLNGGRDQTNARREEVVWMNFQPSGGGSW